MSVNRIQRRAWAGWSLSLSTVESLPSLTSRPPEASLALIT